MSTQTLTLAGYLAAGIVFTAFMGTFASPRELGKGRGLCVVVFSIFGLLWPVFLLVISGALIVRQVAREQIAEGAK
jgi:hypothetical protein